MSGETEEQVSGWTVDTLHSLFVSMTREKDLRDQQRFDAQQLALRDALIAQEKAVTAALEAAQSAVTKAENAAEKRFEAINEFRGQLSDQASRFAEKTVVDRQVEAAADKSVIAVGVLGARLDEYLIRFAALSDSVTTFHAEYGGKTRGDDQSRSTFFAVAAVLLAVAAIVASLVGVFVR